MIFLSPEGKAFSFWLGAGKERMDLNPCHPGLFPCGLILLAIDPAPSALDLFPIVSCKRICVHATCIEKVDGIRNFSYPVSYPQCSMWSLLVFIFF